MKTKDNNKEINTTTHTNKETKKINNKRKCENVKDGEKMCVRRKGEERWRKKGKGARVVVVVVLFSPLHDGQVRPPP